MKFKGIVIKGESRGREMNSPTLNLDFKPESLKRGIYAVKVFFDSKEYAGAMHWGSRPSFADANEIVEIHVLDFEGNLYGKEVSVEVFDYLREIKSFDSKDDLVKQIQHDILKVHEFFKKNTFGQ